MKLLPADGPLLGGIDTWSYLLRSVWWLWPIGAALQLPVFHWLANTAYQWLARNRYCLSGTCSFSSSWKNSQLPQKKTSHSRVFFEMP
jgi:predicted DCC family thiol-disulfide oxidoreductase YuxK